MKRAALVASLAIAAGCSHEARTTSAAADAPPPPRDDARLPPLAAPTHYALSLRIDPSQERFTGRVAIDVEVPRATRFVVLHGRDLAIREASARVGDRVIAARASTRPSHGALVPDELVLAFDAALPAGRAAITVAYDAPFTDDLTGVYRVRAADRWYAFSDFEPMSARRAFPCFDDPSLKATYDVSIEAPAGDLAVANGPEASRAAQGATTRFDFATTPPLPTYLVAFAVGDFDVREAPGAKGPVRIRVLATKGKGVLGDAALEAASATLASLAAYFDLPYPFAKLDLLGVPDYAQGAMENAGLVTFREDALLQDPAHRSADAREDLEETIAHELAHMWFGDLVTMRWWNELWLNEGFATWMERKIVEARSPDLGVALEGVERAQRVMDTDTLASARAVRQPVTSSEEAEEAFDGIAYSKGSALLGMLEHWVGEDAFRRGVRDYLRAHAWKNATAEDLLGALDRASGRDVTAVATSFLDRPGVPLVSVASRCDGGKRAVDLAQTSWRPLGAAPAATSAPPWRFPVCLRDAESAGGPCFELGAARASFTAGGCPAWSFANAGGAGYYRVGIAEDTLAAIARDQAHLDAASRLALITDAWAAVRAGALAPSALLAALPAFDGETERHFVVAVAQLLAEVDRALVSDAERPAFREYAAARMTPRARALGFSPRRDEDPTRSTARAWVLTSLGVTARDPEALRAAEAIASAWLRDPSSADAYLAGAALRVAGLAAGATRLEELRAAARRTDDPEARETLITAMSAFSDPATRARAFDLGTTDEIRRQEVDTLLSTHHTQTPSSRIALAMLATKRDGDGSRASFEWIASHWPALSEKLPGALASDLVNVVGDACTAEDRDREVAFFAPRAAAMDAERSLAEKAEGATACIALRARWGADVARWLGAGASRGAPSARPPAGARGAR